MNPSNRGNGRIFKPDNSRFWHCAFYHAGKEIRESTHVEFLDPDPNDKAHKAALRYLRARIDSVRAERAGGPSVVTPEQKRVTINELLEGLKVDYEARHKWNRKVECLIKPLRTYFGHVRACDLSKTMVTAYMVKMQSEGYKDSTVNRRVQLLLQSFTIAEREAPNVRRLSEIGNERKGFFERADFLRVLEHLPGYLKDYCLFAYTSGWRKGAISKLEWSDVDDSKVYLRAINSKNRKPVTVPVMGEIAEIVARRQAARVLENKTGEVVFSRYVFHRNGKRIGDIRKSWASACEQAKVEGRIFHDFRRTAARNLVAAGVPESVAQNITGHVTNSMFKRYSITSEEQKENALREVAEFHKKQDERKQPVRA
jgi:integrase